MSKTKRKLKKIIVCLQLLVLVVVSAIPCMANERIGNNINLTYNVNNNDTYYSYAKRSLYAVYIGGNVKLNVTNSSKGMQWVWSSGNEEKATITPEGKITGIKTGKVKFTGVTQYKGQEYRINFTTYVKKPKLETKKVTLLKGQKFQAGITGIEEISYKSTNKKVAKVNSKGVVRAKKTGKCTIRIKGEDRKTYKLKIVVKKQKGKYTSNLKDKKGNTIIKFNKLTKKNVGVKVKKRKNKYLKNTSEDYYYVELGKTGNTVIMQLTKEPINDLKEYFSYPISYDKNIKLGVLGMLQGYCTDVNVAYSEEPILPTITTGSGNFTPYYVSYLDKNQEEIKSNYIYVMQKDGYFISLYLDASNATYMELIEIVKIMFGK